MARQASARKTPAAPQRTPPRTARGARTRARLVGAARTVFERDGFLDARLADITEEAGTAAGSFYTYFDSKEEIFQAVLEEIEEEMLHPHVRALNEGDPVGAIEASNRAYLESYQANAKLMRLLEQVATIDDDFRELRKRRSDAFMRRNARAIQEMQAAGVADPTLNPLLAAGALSGMVARAAYTNWVLGEGWDADELADTLTQIWVNALKIEPPATS